VKEEMEMKKRTIILSLALCVSVAVSSVCSAPVYGYEYYDEEDTGSSDEDWVWDAEEDSAEEDEESGDDTEYDEYVYDDGEADCVIVYFGENGGTVDNNVYDKVVYQGQAYGELPTASRTGFLFVGWFDQWSGGTQITADTVCNANEDVILYAHWKSNGGYTITYNTGSGENSDTNVTSYVKSSNDVELSDATSDTQTFVGWYTDSSFKQSVGAISAGTTGNVSLYALFISNPSFSKITTKNNSITLKWKKCENAVSYKIYQSTSAASGYKTVKTVKNATSVTLKNLKYNTSYYYKIAAVYSISGKNLTTDKSGSAEAYCKKGKSGTGASLKPKTSAKKLKSVSSRMKFYYQLDTSWKYSTNQKNTSGFFVSAAMVLNAMGKSVNPNKLYKKMGGKSTAFNPVKIQKNYNVTVNKIDLTGTAKQKQEQLKEALADRTQGVIIRKNNKQVAVAYLDQNGNIKINDPSIKDGANLDIAKSSFKKYSNIDFITTIDKK
jgi:uncharacterized repeat protein (TIGR02543 family)